jgi:hypothetical protein
MGRILYGNEFVPRLYYRDFELDIMVPLDFYIRDDRDIMRADRAIRAKNFGSLAPNTFYIRVWDANRNTSAPGEVAISSAFDDFPFYDENLDTFSVQQFGNWVIWGE